MFYQLSPGIGYLINILTIDTRHFATSRHTKTHTHNRNEMDIESQFETKIHNQIAINEKTQTNTQVDGKLLTNPAQFEL